MNSVKEVEAGKYNSALAEALRNEKAFEKPGWVEFVKSGSGKERPINEEDFWHKRAASILRQIYINKVVGVERLRTRYGGRKNRGKKPAIFVKGGGKIIRVILQQAEKAGFLEKATGDKKGRQLTERGKNFLESILGGKK